MINSILYCYNSVNNINYVNEPEGTKLGLVPTEGYSQIIDLGFTIPVANQNIQELGVLLADNNVVLEPTVYYKYGFSDDGRYLFLYFQINKEYKDLCLRLRFKIAGIYFFSNVFTCEYFNYESTSLLTYRHKENLYGTPYTNFKDKFQQIRIPAYFQRLTTNAEAETSYNPGIIPIEDVSRIERTFKEEYTLISTDVLNMNIARALDCDFIYLNNERVIVDPFIPEEIEEGHWFSKSSIFIQKTGEGFTGSIEFEEFNLVFSYEVISNTVDLTGCINGNVIKVDWGDGSITTDTTHTYAATGFYDIRVKTENTDTLNFQYKNVTSFALIPDEVVKIDCTGCRMYLGSILGLFQLINSKNQTKAQITYPNNNYSFFSKYLIVSSQQTPVVLDSTTIAEAQKLIQKYWFVDYTYNRDFNSSSQPTSSRYTSPANYQKLYPSQHTLQLTPEQPYFFPDENVLVTTSVLKPAGTDWTTFDWDCFVYPRIDVLENNWRLAAQTAFPRKADAEIDYYLGTLPEGVFRLRAVQQSHPVKVGSSIEYNRIKTAELKINVISHESNFINKDSAQWPHPVNTAVTEPYMQFFCFGNVVFSGLGQKLGYNRVYIFSTILTGTRLSSYSIFRTTSAGNYKFKFIDYVIDLSNLTTYLTGLTFYMAYTDPANNYSVVLSNPVYADANGRITLNTEFYVTIPSGCYVCPLITSEVRSGISNINTSWNISDSSTLIISKL